MTPWDEWVKTIKDFNVVHASQSEDVSFVKELRKFLSVVEVAKVLKLVDNTCKRCFNSDYNCLCGRRK